MTTTNKADAGLKQTIEQLIKAATNFDIETLDLIYHDDLEVIMIDNKDQKTIANKTAFSNLFKTKRDQKATALNTWAKFMHIKAFNNTGHVMLERKVNLTGVERTINLSIDLIWEDNRWQVIREVIFTQKNL
ncbi:hypothetical protein [uncultured Lacinutrix sp.]|uniref:hypothetical protein n=1 Tax=uncultured Lacinutrix sp. TaxID=574032 RepID=UPI002606B1A3|nr:hypothetical protein [uncultured Lacinutrix sp.]